MLRIFHMINPIKIGNNTDFLIACKFTFKLQDSVNGENMSGNKHQ